MPTSRQHIELIQDVKMFSWDSWQNSRIHGKSQQYAPEKPSDCVHRYAIYPLVAMRHREENEAVRLRALEIQDNSQPEVPELNPAKNVRNQLSDHVRDR